MPLDIRLNNSKFFLKRGKSMNTKRIVSIALALVLVFSLAACTRTININVKYEGTAPVAGTASSQPTQAPSTSAPQATESKPADDAQKPADDAQKPADDAQKPADDGAASAELSSSSSKEDIVAEYIKVYNTTKATGTFTGHDAMTCDSVQLDGSENSAVKKIADGMMNSNGTDMQLPPYSSDNPATECLITADDVDSATYTDNGDGTATIKIVPKSVTNSKHFEDPQGKMFNVMEDVASTVDSISVLSWAKGDTASNVNLITEGGYAEVTYDKETKMMTKADYVLVTIADVQHASIKMLLLNDKSAKATFTYTMSFPG